MRSYWVTVGPESVLIGDREDTEGHRGKGLVETKETGRRSDSKSAKDFACGHRNIGERHGMGSPCEPLGRTNPCWHFDFRLLASRTARI